MRQHYARERKGSYVVLVDHAPDALLLGESSQVALHEALLEEVSRHLVLLVDNGDGILLVGTRHVCLPFMLSRSA